MSLLAVKAHLVKTKIASLQTLCLLFKTDTEAMRCMLQHFIRKGQLKKCQRTDACGQACFKCPTAQTELYEWIAL